MIELVRGRNCFGPKSSFSTDYACVVAYDATCSDQFNHSKTPPPPGPTDSEYQKILTASGECVFPDLLRKRVVFSPIMYDKGIFQGIQRFVSDGLRHATVYYDLARFRPDFLAPLAEGQRAIVMAW